MDTKHHIFGRRDNYGNLIYGEEITNANKAILALSLATVVVSLVLESMGIL